VRGLKRADGIESTENSSISAAVGETVSNLFESRAAHINADLRGVSSEKSAPLFGVSRAMRKSAGHHEVLEHNCATTLHAIDSISLRKKENARRVR